MISRIALAQVSASEDVEANLTKAEAFVKEAAGRDAHVLCFPEMGLLPFYPQYKDGKEYFAYAETIPGPTVEHFQGLAQRHGIILVLNLFEKNGHDGYFNTTVVIGSGGDVLGKAHMLHIANMPYFHEKFYWQPGLTGFVVIPSPRGTIGIATCYDRHFPEHIRALVLRGAEIILTPQAGIKGEPLEQYQIEMQAASFTNQVYIALVNRVGTDDQIEFAGKSFATDPSGEIITQAGEDKEELLIAECDLSLIKKARRERPYLKDRRPELYSLLHKH